MKPQFDVPFLVEKSYVDYLVDCEEELDSVHFSLMKSQKLDSRIQLHVEENTEAMISQLKRLKTPRKYALMNSRFYMPALLTNTGNMRPILETLAEYLEHGQIDGIVYCDHYLLQRLSDESPEIASSLEAVPGVNTMLDSFKKVEAQLSYIRETKFKCPSKIILDRSLNRDLDRLSKVALNLHTQFPQIHVEVLANEGCLPYCPFKLSHDSYIALANIHGCDNTFDLNCNLGCVRLFDEQPHRILFSPFVRPEDIDLYFYHIDTIKLCGRTLGSQFLKRVITAYRERKYDGNLLDLLDSTNWLTEKLFVDNSSLSFDFANMLSMCDGHCEKCGFCKELFEAIAQPLPLAIQDRRAAAD
ncbi:hypothetical protein [Desulfogranum japonicum]|uniref:hypothetical protein n=1 Tax=Desulfogranum japonicum TaxID=231447 RepID=UPI0003FBF19B|nr:hypothetical protein [Desulfogranum japonicum]